MKQNLEQIRARNALACAGRGAIAGKDDGEVIKKIPPLIMNHGLLAAAAYAMDEKNSGHREAWDGIAAHLADPAVNCLPANCTTCADMINHLTGPEAGSHDLKLCTAEAMAWLSYARRFIRKKS